MKFLFLLGSVFRDWFTVRLKFTLCVLVIFSLSSFVMTFAASLLGGSILWTDDEIAEMLRRYEISNDTDSINISDSFINIVSASEKGNIDYLAIEARGVLLGVGDNQYTQIGLLPCFEETDTNRELLELTELNVTDDGGSYYSITDRCAVSEGRDITDEDCINTAYAVVAPKSLGFGLGGKINLAGCELKVIGLSDGDWLKIPSSTLSEIAGLHSEWVNVGTDAYVINKLICEYNTTGINFKNPISNKSRAEIENAVIEQTGAAVSFTQFVVPDNGLQSAFVMLEAIFGTIIAIFSILCVYNVAVRLCGSTMPMMSLLKLCGMKSKKVSLILFIALFSCLAACYGLACLAVVVTEPIFQSFLLEYVVRDICFIVSAVIMALTALIAILPQIFKLSRAKPDVISIPF